MRTYSIPSLVPNVTRTRTTRVLYDKTVIVLAGRRIIAACKTAAACIYCIIYMQYIMYMLQKLRGPEILVVWTLLITHTHTQVAMVMWAHSNVNVISYDFY